MADKNPLIDLVFGVVGVGAIIVKTIKDVKYRRLGDETSVYTSLADTTEFIQKNVENQRAQEAKKQERMKQKNCK